MRTAAQNLILLITALAGLFCASAQTTFTNVNAGLPGVLGVGSSAAWGDFDNEGKLDLLLTGSTNDTTGGVVSQIWRNLGNGVFTNIQAGLPGVWYSSVAWGDYDNDGRLDILLSGLSAQGPLLQIWRNLGNGSFTNIQAALPGVAFGALSWGDFDRDGRLDILLTGEDTNGNAISQIWRNLGNGSFTNLNAGLPGVTDGAVAVADFDGDGKLDFVLTGFLSDGVTPVTQIWRNLGGGVFTNLSADLPGVGYSSVAVGDFDNDGKPDILLAGDSSGVLVTQVWRNLGGGVFTNLSLSLPGVYYGSVVWGDFDNDGNLDILLTGLSSDGVTPVSQVWRNLGNGAFTNLNATLPGVMGSSVALCDFDNDGRLDALLTGLDPGDTPISQIWRNLGPQTNNIPASPSGLSAVVTNTGVLLSWNAASDPQTPASGLSYNLRVGTAPGGFGLVSPQSDPATGFRRVPQPGNLQQRLSTALTNLTQGATYYWSVQAVDTSFAGSAFATEGNFTIAAAVVFRPGLVIQPLPPGRVLISWPSAGSNFVLQSTTTLTLSNSWQPVTNVPTVTLNWLYVTNSTVSSLRFYRLRGP